MKGDFSHSIGEVISMSDYEEIQFELLAGVERKFTKPTLRKELDSPKEAKEEKLGALRESSHG